MSAPKLKCVNAGNLSIDFITNQQGLKLKTYVWKVDHPIGNIIFFHGLRSHVFFTFLKHANNPIEKNENENSKESYYPRCLTYTDSWIEKINKSGFSFCSLDLQGHGSSEGVSNSRFNLEMFDDLTFDCFQFLLNINRTYTDINGHNLPLFIAGVSMGGGTTIRVMQLYRFIKKTSKVPDRYFYDSQLSFSQLPRSALLSERDIVNECSLLKLIGGVAICPNLKIPLIDNKIGKTIIMKLMSLASYIAPNIRAIPIKPTLDIPWIDIDRQHDELDGDKIDSRLSIRLCHENLLLGSRVISDLELLYDTPNDNLSILLIHGSVDVTTDPEGSREFKNKLINRVKDIDYWEISDLGHNIIHSENNYEILIKLIEWFLERCK